MTISPKNKIYNLGYFRSRLNTAGIRTIAVWKSQKGANSTIGFPDDNRRWTVVCYPETHNIFITCVKEPDSAEATLWFYDFGKKIQGIRMMQTVSVQQVLGLLHSLIN